jgi:hypothetical protein
MRVLAVIVALLGAGTCFGGLALGVNEAAPAFGWGERVTIHVDHLYTYRHLQRNRTTHVRQYVTEYDLEGHYTRDGTTHQVKLDGNYPVGADVPGYLPILGGTPTTHTGGPAVFLSLLGFLIVLPSGLALVLLAGYLWRKNPDQKQPPSSAPPYPGPLPYQGQQHPPSWR